MSSCTSSYLGLSANKEPRFVELRFGCVVDMNKIKGFYPSSEHFNILVECSDRNCEIQIKDKTTFEVVYNRLCKLLSVDRCSPVPKIETTAAKPQSVELDKGDKPERRFGRSAPECHDLVLPNMDEAANPERRVEMTPSVNDESSEDDKQEADRKP